MAKKKKGKKQGEKRAKSTTTVLPIHPIESLDHTSMTSEASTIIPPLTHPLLQDASLSLASPVLLPVWDLPLNQSSSSVAWAFDCFEELSLENYIFERDELERPETEPSPERPIINDCSEAPSLEREERQIPTTGYSSKQRITENEFYEHLSTSYQLCNTLTAVVDRLETDLVRKEQLLKAANYAAKISQEGESKVKTKRADELKKQRADLTAKFKWEIESLQKEVKEKAQLLEMNKKEVHARDKKHERGLLDREEKHKAEMIKLSSRIEELQTLAEERNTSNATLEDNIEENKRLKERCHELYDMYARQRQSKECYMDDATNMRREVGAMANKLDHLKERQDPLLQIGVAVRKRFLEQARATIPVGEEFFEDDTNHARDPHPVNLPTEDEDTWGKPDRSVIEKGNIAAHRGNCEADAALFDRESMEGGEYEQLYKRMYRMDPRRLEEGHYSAELRKIRNCEATISALVTVSFHAGDRRQPVLDRLAGLAKAVRFAESEFADDEEAQKLDEHVEEAEKMTEEFVEKYRRR